MSANDDDRSPGLLNTDRSNQQHGLTALRGGYRSSTGPRPRQSSELRNVARIEVADSASVTSTASAASSDSVDFSQLNQTSFQYDHRPDEAQSWLREFGNLKPGTQVSRNLKVTCPQSDTSLEGSAQQYVSCLPFLTRWLKQSFEDALNARKKAQKNPASRAQALKEQHRLHWLCTYIRDYLTLDHASLALPDIQSLAIGLFEICFATSEAQDIEDAIDVLYATLLRWPYPVEILEQTLQVLCRVRFYFSRHSTPARLADCVEILAKGPMGPDVLKILYASLRPSSNTLEETTQLRIARGSVLVLKGMVNSIDRDGKFLLGYNEVIPALSASSDVENLRLSADILDFCDEFLKEGPRLHDSISHDWEILIQVIRKCVAPFTPTKNAVNKLQPAYSSNQAKVGENSTDSGNLRLHSEAVHRLNDTLCPLLKRLSDSNSIIVYDYLMEFRRNLSEEQCLAVLQYADERRLIWPQNAMREAHIQAISDFLNPAHTFTPITRTLAVEAMEHALRSKSQSLTENNEFKAWTETSLENAMLLRILLDQILVEKDADVLRMITSALCDARDSDSALQMVLSLRQLVTSDYQEEDGTGDRVHVATHALSNLFLHHLGQTTKVGVAAFEALIEAASLRCHSLRARLSAITLLMRLRCDSAGLVYFQTDLESEYIAEALCRTRSSFEEFDNGSPDVNRSSTSSSSLTTSSSSNHPLWMYPDLEPLPQVAMTESCRTVARGHSTKWDDNYVELDVGLWLWNVIQCLQNDSDWETYSFIVVHLGSQLSNTDLFLGCLSTVVKLRQVLSELVSKGSFFEPPSWTGLKKHDVALCVFNILTPLISFATMKSEHIQKGFGDDLVRCFLGGVAQSYEGTSRGCIHSLSICCLELPASVASSYPAIVERMSKNMSQPHLTMHILEFLAQVARLPQVHSKFREDEITMIFSICIQFLEKAREQHVPSAASPTSRLGTPSGRPTSGVNFRRPPYRAAMTQDIGLPQYASALAYHTMIFWFLSLKLEVRAKYVAWIVPRLVWKNSKGEETVDEQSQAFIDMMQRAAFSDLGETLPHPDFAGDSDGPISSASWIVGMSVVTAETAGHTGITQITKRQASGTTYAVYRQFTAELPAHHAPSNTEILPEIAGALPTEMLPSHILLQMVASAAPTSLSDQPVPLPKDDFVARALASFDRIPTVDSHKIGILYIGPSQRTESEYLANTTGSNDYVNFLHNIGYPVSLEPPLRFNPMGLQYPRDGKTTMAWRDRVTEIIYHVPTLMPTNLEDDPQSVAKKAHVGNDHVNVIFNDSGLAWNFDNFKSQLNYVNIVITPANRRSNPDQTGPESHEDNLRPQPAQQAFYKVHVLTKPSFPSISPAADPKIISAAQLPQFVRMISLNANVYCQAWNAREIGDGEFPSNWRSRLQEIKRLRERIVARMGLGGSGAATAGSSTSLSAASSAVASTGQGRRTPIPVPVPGSRDRERDVSGPHADGLLAERLDFSRWTLE